MHPEITRLHVELFYEGKLQSVRGLGAAGDPGLRLAVGLRAALGAGGPRRQHERVP